MVTATPAWWNLSSRLIQSSFDTPSPSLPRTYSREECGKERSTKWRKHARLILQAASVCDLGDEFILKLTTDCVITRLKEGAISSEIGWRGPHLCPFRMPSFERCPWAWSSLDRPVGGSQGVVCESSFHSQTETDDVIQYLYPYVLMSQGEKIATCLDLFF